MPIQTYTQGYPPDGSTLGSTKAVIRDNLDGTFLTLGVDHINNNGQPGSNTPGYHNVIHLVKQASDPSAIGLTGQLYAKQIVSGGNNDEALFYESGGGRIYQLTTNTNGAGNSWSANQTGWTTMIGGIIVQWGIYTAPGGFSSGSTTGSITLPLAFPNTAFIALANPIISSSNLPNSPASINVYDSSFGGVGPVNSFGWQFYTSSHDYVGFFWYAIGN
jgi:hypothetical protein